MAIAAYAPIFYLKTFPSYVNEYAMANAAALSIFGFASSLLGGLISDAFEKKNLMTKAWVCIIGSLSAFPLILFAT